MIKLSETKWLNETEEYIAFLTKGCKKKVAVVCPRCGEAKLMRWANFLRYDSTFCKKCTKTRFLDEMIGKRFGRLTVVSVGAMVGNTTSLNVICDCGNIMAVVPNSLRKGATTSCGCYYKEKMRGATHPNFDASLSDEERKKKRNITLGLSTWRKSVLERDNFVCQVCNADRQLVAHHLDGYKNHKELATDVNNGITLCRECHVDFHVNFMGSYHTPVTREDFEKYLEQI